MCRSEIAYCVLWYNDRGKSFLSCLKYSQDLCNIHAVCKYSQHVIISLTLWGLNITIWPLELQSVEFTLLALSHHISKCYSTRFYSFWSLFLHNLSTTTTEPFSSRIANKLWLLKLLGEKQHTNYDCNPTLRFPQMNQHYKIVWKLRFIVLCVRVRRCMQFKGLSMQMELTHQTCTEKIRVDLSLYYCSGVLWWLKVFSWTPHQLFLNLLYTHESKREQFDFLLLSGCGWNVIARGR